MEPTDRIVFLERENHRLRCELADALREAREADARARTWRRVAQWIHDAHTPRKDADRAQDPAP